MNNTIENTQKSFRDIRAENKKKIDELYNKCETNEAFLVVLDRLLDNNIESLNEIVTKMKAIERNSNTEEIDERLAKLQSKVQDSKELKLEKDTLILITDQRNKNIEMYYVIYIVFIVLFIIIQTSIIIFK